MTAAQSLTIGQYDEGQRDAFYRADTEPWGEEDPLTQSQTEMDYEVQDDARSVASTATSVATSVLSKRKVPSQVEDPGGESGTIPRRTLRPKKTKVFKEDDVTGKSATIDIRAREIPLPQDTEDTTGTLTCSDGEDKKADKKKKKSKKVLSSKRRTGPTIESQLREVPATLDELTDSPVVNLGSSALEWLDDIDIIRVGTSMQGGLSSHIKRRLNVVKQVVRVMAEKIEDVGDPGFLRRRNAELTAELRVSKRETAQLRRDLADLKKIVEDLKSRIGNKETPPRVYTSDKASSPVTLASYPTPNRESLLLPRNTGRNRRMWS